MTSRDDSFATSMSLKIVKTIPSGYPLGSKAKTKTNNKNKTLY